jgi:hypothetical protein
MPGDYRMNDLTKDELEEIHDCILREGRYYFEDRLEAIVLKLDNLVGNYCDHTWEMVPVDCNRYGCDTTYNKCKRCGRMGEYE